MNTPTFSRRFLISHNSLLVLYSLLTCIYILFSRFPILSTSSLLLIFVPFCMILVSLFTISQILTNKTTAQSVSAWFLRNPTILQIAFMLSVLAISLGALAACLPAYHFGGYSAYYVLSQPLLLWAGLLGTQFLSILLHPRRTEITSHLLGSLKENSGVLWLSFWILFAFVLLWIFVAITKLGISGKEDFWYEAGVPILPLQILFSMGAGFLFVLIEKSLKITRSFKLDLGIFLGIWLLTALVWASTPVPDSFFNPAALPPNHQVYPYSDAAEYDLQSQSALMGLGLKNGNSLDNPIYPAFLVFVHAVTGQNYSANMALQAGIYAVLPAIVYLLGNTLFGPELGIAAAVMMSFHGYNSIAANALINQSSPKQMMLDFPTALGVALSILTAMYLWRDRNQEHPERALLSGAAVGFAFLIRPTALVLLAITPGIALIRRLSFGKILRIVLLLLAGFIIFIAPWGVRNQLSLHGDALKTYLIKFRLVSHTRFRDVTKEKNTQKAGNNPELPQGNETVPLEAQPTPSNSLVQVISNHFVHNILTSVLILPTSLQINDLTHTLKSPNTVWEQYWNGSLGVWNSIGLLISLLILAIGIAASWNRNPALGLIPLLAFLLYQIANSIGRTSGGRYIVPADWIIIFYYAIGLYFLGKTLFHIPETRTAESISTTKSSPKMIVITSLLILFFGTFPVFSDFLFANYKPQVDPRSFLSQPDIQNILTLSGYRNEDISAFLSTKHAITLSGQAMYPKYLDYRAIAKNTPGRFRKAESPHLEFTLLGENGTQTIVLYNLSTISLLNNSSVIILGCTINDKKYIDAIAIIETDSVNSISFREDKPALSCPLPLPVCDKNGNCQ